MNRDRIYSLPHQRVGEFAFDDAVAEVFPDMIARSVPGYASILSVIEQLAARYIQPETNVYDLGCSLGAATLLMRSQAPASCTIHAIDNSAAMISRLETSLAHEADRQVARSAVRTHRADIRGFPMSNASLIVLNLTLQFVPAPERFGVLQAAFEALNEGGALLISEKVCFDNAETQALLTELHHDFKRAHGYSELEIAQKRTAIENRLIPETLDTHTRRLHDVGFATIVPWFQCFNFVSILAVKSPR